METQYRIANKGGKYYPQVRVKKFLLYYKWMKIGQHEEGFGLYELPNWEHPKTEEQCHKIILNFDLWFHNETTVEYKKVIINK